jgi:methyl-accepting chemotaxis protein
LSQISTAMSQLNQATQQNAAASEQLAATAEEMSGQASALQELMAFFSIEDGTPPALERGEPRARAAATRPAAIGGNKPAALVDESYFKRF